MEDYGIWNWILIVVVLLTFAAFIFVIRELVCWYLKINQRINIQSEILEQLKKLNERQNDAL